MIVANADQLVVVTALADPEPQPRLIDRALVAAYDAGMEPLLCLTKADLADPDDAASTYRSLGVPWVVTRRGGDLAELRERLAGRTSVLVGPSGVGKSTLVNALVPERDRAVGVVNAVTGRGPAHVDLGAHAGAARTATGWIIDTPGIRSFGLAHVEPEDLIEAFPDLDEWRRTARAGARTATTSRSAGWTGPSPRAGPTRSASRPSAASSPADSLRRTPTAGVRAPRRARLVHPIPVAHDYSAPGTTMTCASPTSSPTRPTRSRMARSKAIDLRVKTKPDLTPVTDADQAAEEVIRG